MGDRPSTGTTSGHRRTRGPSSASRSPRAAPWTSRSSGRRGRGGARSAARETGPPEDLSLIHI
eukprot:9636933-Alexandrium_andersonii.AAC.1